MDTGFGQNYDRRRSALEALLGWWLEIGPALGNISPKILLREDIWTGLNFTNKTYYTSRTVQLRWEEEDLWRLVLRQALQKSPTLAELVQQHASIEPSRLIFSSFNSMSSEEDYFPFGVNAWDVAINLLPTTG